MKKLLGLTLAMALVSVYMPAQASAELLRNLRLSGQLDLQTQSSRNVVDFVTRPNPSITPSGANPLFNDRLNNAHTRLILGLDFDLLDDVHAKLTLRKNDRAWGTAGQANGAWNGAASQSLLANAAGNVLGSVYVDQANVKVMKTLGGLLDATIGRQFYGESGDAVIYYGPSDKALYGQPSNALDAVRVDIPVMGDMLSITALAGKNTGSNVAAVAGADVDVKGIVLKSKPMDGLMTQAHIYNRTTHGTDALGNMQNQNQAAAALSNRNDTLYVYGLKGRWQGMGFNVGLEYDRNGGENRLNSTLASRRIFNLNGVGNNGHVAESANYMGQAVLLDAAYTADVEHVASFMPWINFNYGSGRGDITQNKNEGFTSIMGDVRQGTIMGRFAATGATVLGTGIPCANPGVSANTFSGCGAGGLLTNGGVANGGNSYYTAANGAGLNNRIIWGFGLKATPAALNQLTAAVSWWSYRMQRVTGNGYNNKSLADQGIANANVAGNNGQGNNQKQIGSELDFDLTWKHSDNVMFAAGVAGFKPGKYILEQIRTAQVNGANNQVGANGAVIAYGDMRIKF